MRIRRGGLWLSIPLTIALATAAGCTSDNEPQHNAGSIHDAAQQLGPKASDLKQLDGMPMNALPDGLKPLDGDDGKTEPEPAVAGLKPMSKESAPAGLPAGLKAFPAEPTEAAKAEPAADAEAAEAAADEAAAEDAEPDEAPPEEAPAEPTAE
jgi:hypothetical protein